MVQFLQANEVICKHTTFREGHHNAGAEATNTDFFQVELLGTLLQKEENTKHKYKGDCSKH